ncbi:2-hydroxymuconic semialdehyde hydrolase [uncultured Coleofasciculus sp.]|uniref:2-hydroxymuconic semialdehyde hydrolase n=1 Tax=uncultured Coleofasciculus sp. TaxID=1267456 RepID=A0A6J4HXG8_9CYAN|nr:2-hydroxymuconic semialdehyde hydrolase [uncultured Coleofasciculus sp.]
MLSELDYSILSTLKTLKLNGFERNDLITDTWLATYRAPFSTPEESIGGIGWARGYATGAHRFEVPDSSARAALSAKPATAIWGEADRTLHAEHFLPLFAAAFPNGLMQQLPGAGHYSFKDEPVVIASLIDQFIRLT